MRNTPICYIAGALPLPQHLQLKLESDDLLIAADGGHSHLTQLGLTPHLVVGDFDSSHPPDRPDVIQLPVEKDDTDMGYAIGLGRSRHFKNFVLLGGLGGLLDHSIANLQHLHGLSMQNCTAILIGDCQCATVITNGSLTLSGMAGSRCSIFALGGDAQGVTLKNLHYPLKNANLSPLFPLGVSNSFLDTPAEISVDSGSILVIWDDLSPTILNFFTH